MASESYTMLYIFATIEFLLILGVYIWEENKKNKQDKLNQAKNDEQNNFKVENDI